MSQNITFYRNYGLLLPFCAVKAAELICNSSAFNTISLVSEFDFNFNALVSGKRKTLEVRSDCYVIIDWSDSRWQSFEFCFGAASHLTIDCN